MWADDIDGSLKKAGGDANVTTLNAPHLEQIRARFAELAKQAKPTDALVVILIGHGTYDGARLQVQHPRSGPHRDRTGHACWTACRRSASWSST